MDKLSTKDAIVNKLRCLRENKLKSNKKEFDVTNDNKLKDALVGLKSKMPGAPRIVLLAGFNEAAKPELIKENLAKIFVEETMNINSKSATLEGNIPHDFQYLRITTDNKINPELETENYIFLTCPRILEIFLDYCKVADIVCVVLSCKDADSPSVASDEKGYTMLDVMKAQGFPSVVGVLQDLETIDASKQADVKETFQKFSESELGIDEKVVTTANNDPKAMMAFMKVLQEVTLKQLEWREIRSYLLAEKLQVDPQNHLLEIEGFLKGNYFNPNQFVHITGYGDYPVLQVDILHNPFMPNGKRQKLVEYIKSSGLSPDENVLASFFAEESKMEDYDQFSNENTQGDDEFGLTKEEIHGKGEFLADFEENEIENEDSDTSFEEDNTDFSASTILEEKKKLRDDDEKLLDEVDFPPDMKAYERFMKYRGLKDFKTYKWDPFSDLPAEYERIFTFADFSKSQKLAIEKTQKEAVAYDNFYIKIYVTGFPVEKLANCDKKKPIVVSSLLSHERKISVLNLKVKSSSVISSKETLEIHLGFRILTTQPIFSQLINGANKTKYEKKAQKDQFYMASFYGEVTYPPANAVIFRTNENGTKELAASGELMKPDPFQVIIKRVILTGIPVKTHKRLAVVKMMFFNNKDVSWFRPVKLFTKHGLEGFIKESVGKNGCMKCVFNAPIQKNDTVCLNLYKRVFPKWPFEPVQQDNAWN